MEAAGFQRRRRRNLGWIGIAIVIVGAAVAALGIVYYLHARPKPGEVIDRFAIDAGHEIVVRAEDGGPRSFLELRHGDEVMWQALIPHYAGAKGRPAIAWSQWSVTARVEREGRAEVFALSMHDGTKLGGFRLAPEHEPVRMHPEGPITLTDHARSYELVGGADWHEIVAVDLRTGHALWKVSLGATPIDSGSVEGGVIRLGQGGSVRTLSVFTGAATELSRSTGP
jgi:hypothetical protein